LPLPSTSTVPTPEIDAVLNDVPGDDAADGLAAAVVVGDAAAVVVDVVLDELLLDELHAASTIEPVAARSSTLRTTMSRPPSPAAAVTAADQRICR
jgi:hypothetical protein